MAISTISQAGLNAPITLTSPVIAGTPTGVGVLTSGTAVATTSVTAIDFTAIPSWVKRITVMFAGVSTNGTSSLLIQIGSGSVTSTGYVATANFTNQSSTTAGVSSTAGFPIYTAGTTYVFSGAMTIHLISGNTYISNHSGKNLTDGANFGGGDVTLGGTLDRVRITTVNGTSTFDAGSVNILYE